MRRFLLPLAPVLFVFCITVFFSFPAHAYNGKLKVKCNVDAEVYLNDIRVGKTGEVISGLPFGRCRMKVVAEGYKHHVEMVDIVGNDVIEVKVDLEKGEGVVNASEREKPKEKEGGGEKEKETEKKKPVVKKPEKADMREVGKMSKAENTDRLKDILKSDSEYLVRLAAAAALIRLESTAGADFIESGIDLKFSEAPSEWFKDSPLYDQFRTLAGDEAIADAIEDREVKFDSFENLVTGFAAIRQLRENQLRLRKEIKDHQKKMIKLKRKKPDGWWGEHSQHGHNIEMKSKRVKNAHAFESRLTSLLKKAVKLKDKDLAALAKYLHDRASGKIKD